MSILNLSFQGNSIAAGFCVNAPAKRNHSQKQKSDTFELRGRVGFDRLEKGAAAKNFLDSNVPQLTRKKLGLAAFQGNSIAAGFRVNALAKKNKPQKQKSRKSEQGDGLAFDRLKKGISAENGLDSDVAELTRTNLGLTAPAEKQKPNTSEQRDRVGFDRLEKGAPAKNFLDSNVPQLTRKKLGLAAFQGNSIAAGFRVNALAKKNKPQKQKFRKSEQGDGLAFYRLKKGISAENGLDSDVAELTRTNLGLTAPAEKQKPNTAEQRDRVGFNRLKKGIFAEKSLDSDATELTRTNLAAVDGPTEEDGRETNEVLVAERGNVLRAGIATSVGLSLAGIFLRQVFPDMAILMPLRTELWHLIPTVGVVVGVTSLRQILQKSWPDFALSSQTANRKVLTSLEPVDILTVSCLSGASEELLFRGGVLPLLGPDWKGVLGAGVIFGVLHLTGGRNTSFAIWASFVGMVYGILGLYTCDLAAPMTAHSIANLLGAAIWKVGKSDEESKSV